MATVSAWLALMTRVPTRPRSDSAVSIVVSCVALVGEHLEARAEVVDGRREVALLGREPGAEPVEPVEGAHDVGLLLVEAADEGVELADRALDVVLAALPCALVSSR